MNTSATATGLNAISLKKKRSLRQILIPTRSKSQRSLRKQSLSSSTAPDTNPISPALPQNYVAPVSDVLYFVEPQSATSSRAPSSLLSADSTKRSSSSKETTKVEEKVLVKDDEIKQLPENAARKTGRDRASTLTNFSKPYGTLQDQTVPPESPQPIRKTSHQTLGQSPVETSPKLYRAITDGPLSATHEQRHPKSRSLSKSTINTDADPFVSVTQLPIRSSKLRSPGQVYPELPPKDEDTRGSNQSVASTTPSQQESKHSSTFTKISSSTEITSDEDFVVDGKETITVNDLIDLYAELDDDTETQVSPDTLELQERSMRIAEAINAPLDSPPTPGREPRSPSTPLINAQRVRNILHEPPALMTPTATHDHYGFRKVSRDVTLQSYNEWYEEYSKFQVRRNAKWQGLLSDFGIFTTRPKNFPPPSSRVQRYIRKGIPPAWRGDAWFYYAEAGQIFAAHPDHYVNLVVRSQTDALNRNDREAVERDLHRTFPDNIHFKAESSTSSNEVTETPIMTALRRLLCAFAVDHPKTGYCQSLNFIAGLLLLFLPEEKAYWMLHIMTSRMLPGTHELSLEGANIDLWVLMLALKQANPGVWAKVGGDVDTNSTRLPPISLCTTSWFMSAFIGTLPVESVLRVWDVLFYEGSKTLFRVALAIFKSGEGQIKSVLDPMETFQVVQTLPRKMVDVGGLFDIAFGRGEVGKRWIEKKRAERRGFYAKERAVEKARRQSREIGPRRPSTGYVDDLQSPSTIDMASPDDIIETSPQKDYWTSTSTIVKPET